MSDDVTKRWLLKNSETSLRFLSSFPQIEVVKAVLSIYSQHSSAKVLRLAIRT